MRDEIKQENQQITTSTLHNEGIEAKNPYLKDLSTNLEIFLKNPELELGQQK